MRKIKMLQLQLLNENRKEDLANLYLLYFKEVHADEITGDITTVTTMLDAFDNLGRLSYVLYDDKLPIGFLTMFCNTQYGMTKPVLYLEYMYLLPTYRSGRAIAMLYSKLGELCILNNMDGMGATYTTSANAKNNLLLDGEVIAGVTHFKLQSIKSNTNRLLKYLNKGQK